MDDLERAVAASLSAARRALGLTQTQVSASTGYAQPVISRFESGLRTPSVAQLYVLADAYGRAPSDFLPTPKQLQQGRDALRGGDT